MIAAGLTTAGHEVDSAVDEGLGGAADDEVLFAAAAADRVLITQDKGHGDHSRPIPHRCPGVVRLAIPGAGPGALLARLLDVLPRLDPFIDTLHIVTARTVRSAPLRGVTRDT